MRAVATTVAAAAAVTLVIAVGQRVMARGVGCMVTRVMTLMVDMTLMVPIVMC